MKGVKETRHCTRRSLAEVNSYNLITKHSVQLKIFGVPDLKIDEIEGIIQREKIPPSKPITNQVRADDVKYTDNAWAKYRIPG